MTRLPNRSMTVWFAMLLLLGYAAGCGESQQLASGQFEGVDTSQIEAGEDAEALGMRGRRPRASLEPTTSPSTTGAPEPSSPPRAPQCEDDEPTTLSDTRSSWAEYSLDTYNTCRQGVPPWKWERPTLQKAYFDVIEQIEEYEESCRASGKTPSCSKPEFTEDSGAQCVSLFTHLQRRWWRFTSESDCTCVCDED